MTMTDLLKILIREELKRSKINPTNRSDTNGK
jgi:hypothetical protein